MPNTLEKYRRLPDCVNLVVAGLLFLAPMFLAFFNVMSAAWNAWLMAHAIGAVALAAIIRYDEWTEWLNAFLGIWLLASPWVLGFADNIAAFWTHVVLGVTVVLLSVSRGAMAQLPGSHTYA